MNPSVAVHTITRDDLYQKVWAIPMSKLALEYGVSDVALAKICRRLNVPRPPRGYWAKIEAGQRVKKIDLPKVESTAQTSATIDPERVGRRLKIRSNLADKPNPLTIIPNDLRGCHPLVTATRKALESVERPHQGIVRQNTAGALSVSVAKSSIHRALIICEALIHGFSKMGWQVESSKDSAQTIVRIGNDPVWISLTEKINRIELPLTRIWRNFDYVPSGLLTLRVHGVYGTKLRSSWSDGKTQRLEELLDEVVMACGLHSEELKIDRIEREAREKRWQEQERQRRIHAEKIKAEQLRRSLLINFSSSWEKVSKIRDFCVQLESRARSNSTDFNPQDVERWLKWAYQVMDRIDPFQSEKLKVALADTDLDATLDCQPDL